MQTDLISVVVPVYNVEKYLPDFFLSLDKQTYRQFEVIFVNDGSKDNSGALLDQYAKDKPYVKVIHQPNQGVSIARNNGLKEATGEYLMFLDPDDMFVPTMFEALIGCAKRNQADLAQSTFFLARENEHYHYDNYHKIRAREHVYEGQDTIMTYALSNFLGYGYPWRKIYRHDLLKKDADYPNLFSTKCRFFDDSLFCYRITKYAHCIVDTRLRLYRYRTRKSGITASKFDENKFTIFMNRDLFNTFDSQTYSIALTYVKTAIAMIDFLFLWRVINSDFKDLERIRPIDQEFRTNLRYYWGAKKHHLYLRIGMPLMGPITHLALKIKKKI